MSYIKVIGNLNNAWNAIVQNSLLCVVLGGGRGDEVWDAVFPHLLLEDKLWCVPVASTFKWSSAITSERGADLQGLSKNQI